MTTNGKYIAPHFYRARRRKRAAGGKGEGASLDLGNVRAAEGANVLTPCPRSTCEAAETNEGNTDAVK
ncbi:hypothetical protein GCM10011617_26920 [Novosphingobium arvoryzae]|uniref:Uncharacterized protein n=1 Tax=Novosphingobium arvoryzae TaxID=1256514 RepID=A0A918RM45_9SPHN|nr:hypothetical protein GCM10011617_26920 [Novosphingobium arvoryzae]